MATGETGADLALRCEGLSKRFPERPRDVPWKHKLAAWLGRRKVDAVTDVTFEVKRGEIFGVVGPNGAGKTTTLKMLLGLLRPTAGRAFVLGHPVPTVEARRRVGYLPEHPYFYGHLRPLEFLEMCAALCDVPRAGRRRRCLALLERVGLTPALDRPLRKFSKGMLQRVGVAQALVGDAELVILDEPLSGLDPIGRKELRDFIPALRAEGKTVVFSSHILHDVELLCDRVALLINGRLRAVGTLESLLSPKVLSVEMVFSPVAGDLFARARAAAEAAGAAVAVRGERAAATLPGDEQTGALLRALLDAGATVHQVTPRRQSLEDHFVAEVGPAHRTVESEP
jgi:ABC-2 type transport system ATP-binding protein